MKRAIPYVAAGLVLVVAVVIGVVLLTGDGTKHVKAYFARATGLYTGSTVRILGVPVGKITKIKPEGDHVEVDMEYSGKYKLPADAAAVLIPPSIVSDRYVEFTPPSEGGQAMPDNAVIPQDRTEVPAELDEVFKNFNDLNTALGPQGANSNGALRKLIDVSAANLKGNGLKLHTTLHDFAQAISALADNRNDLFATVRNLQDFTTALARDDGGVRRLNSDLAQVSAYLDTQRSELGQALANLSVALGQVASFVQQNRSALKSDVSDLRTITDALLTERRALEEVIDDAGLGLTNLALAYDPASQTLRTRNSGSYSSSSGAGTPDPTAIICTIVKALGQQCPAPGSGPPIPTTGLPVPSSGATSADQSLQQLLGGAG
jgi:phospholipid/cholesterol/gamma-HCH transport system substrate-binding protein